MDLSAVSVSKLLSCLVRMQWPALALAVFALVWHRTSLSLSPGDARTAARRWTVTLRELLVPFWGLAALTAFGSVVDYPHLGRPSLLVTQHLVLATLLSLAIVDFVRWMTRRGPAGRTEPSTLLAPIRITVVGLVVAIALGTLLYARTYRWFY